MRLPEREDRAPLAPDGCVVYAIGDIHGRIDLLTRATEELERQANQGRAAVRTISVFLGDYVDRGPGSAAVVDHLIGLAARAPFEPIFLRGNHEQSMLDVADGNPRGARWLDYGGRETLASYGVEIPRGADLQIERLREAIARSVPAGHIAFLRATEIYRKLGDYIFVHAGLRPDRLLEEQSVDDMLWLRHPSDEPPLWPETVVHGHSPHSRPVAGRWHVGIDTGAHDRGALTLLRLEGSQKRFLKVVAGKPAGSGDITLWETVDRHFPSGPEPLRRARKEVGPTSRRRMLAAGARWRIGSDAPSA